MAQENARNAEKIILGGLSQVNEFNLNVAQNIITITEDRLRLHLIGNLKKMERKNAWIAPLGIFLAIMLSFITTDFKDIVGLKAATWQAVFIIAAILAFIWLIYSVVQLTKTETIDELIEKIKKEPK